MPERVHEAVDGGIHVLCKPGPGFSHSAGRALLVACCCRYRLLTYRLHRGFQDWFESTEHEAAVKGAALRLIELFGVDRCMFASNFPVDKEQVPDVQTLYSRFYQWVKDRPEADLRALFHDTAMGAYKLRT